MHILTVPCIDFVAGGPEDVEESHGEFLGLRNIDDSGIESGEDLKGVNPEVMKEVEEALVRLECILPGLDVSRREAVSKLVNSLQSCLRLPPRRRITIGVSPGELAAARKWLKPPLEEMIIEHVNYCPVLQRPGYLMEPAPQQGILSYIPKTERSLSDSGSLQDYDPSLRLFTPEQTVQIAIHKAAIKKQISQEGKRRESSDDGDVSSGEESCEVNNYNEVSSAQRLLQMASESAKKNPSAARFHNRSSKKLKMKRANTIDIPKPANFFEYSSGDEYGASADEVSIDVERKHHNKEIKFLPPSFEPKTENDLKFLAFLKQVNENQPKMQTYNPSARGGKHWSNRFSSIKTTFEHTEQPKMSVPSPAKMFWQNSEAHQNNDYKDQYKNKLPWTVKTGDNGVVVGSLTVAKPGHVNNFNHAPKSAFKPIEKKPVSTVSGTVKQIAAQKFSVSDSETEKRPEKNSKKQTNVPHSHTNYTPNTKQNTFINNTSSAFKKYNSSPQSNNFEKAHSKITTHPSSNSNYTSFKSFDTSNINNEKSMNIQKYNITQNKPSANLQSNVKSYQYNTSTQPYTNNTFPSKTQQNTLAAKKQFMQVTSNSAPQNSEYKPSTHISNHQDNNSHGFGHNLSTSYGYQPSTCSTEFQNDYKKSSQNLPLKKNEYKISYQVSNPSNNGYQSSSYSKNQEKSMFHSSNEVIPPQNVSSKTISKNINGSSSKYPYGSSVNPNPYSDEDYKQSPTLHLEKNNFRIENNDDFSIIDDKKQTISKNDIYSSASGYPNFSENNDIYKQNNYSDPSLFKNKPYTAYIYSSNNTANSSDSFDQRHDVPHISTDKPNHVTQTVNGSPLLIKEDPPPSSPYSLSVSSSLDRMSPQRISSIKFPDDNRYLSPSYQSMSPSLRIEEDESPWGSVTNGDDSPLEEKAVSRVMGQAQCQQAVTVNNRTRRRFDLDLESELKLQVRQSAQKKSLSPSFPNVIQKSESWHQMVKEQMQQAKQAPPLPKISKAKSSHTLALPKQYEAALSQETLTQKKITVSQYLSKQSKATKSTRTNPKYKSTNTINIQQEDDDLADVDEVFESIFQESNKKRNSK